MHLLSVGPIKFHLKPFEFEKFSRVEIPDPCLQGRRENGGEEK